MYHKELAIVRNAQTFFHNNTIFNTIFSFRINVSYENGFSQQIGNRALDTYDKLLDIRVGTSGGMNILIAVLKALGVDDLSQATDRIIWVLKKDSSYDADVVGIQALDLHQTNTKPVVFNDFS